MKKLASVVVLETVLMAGSLVFAEAPLGEALYRKKMCYACHGIEGKGGPAGSSLKNIGKSREELNEFLKKGSAKMKPFKGTDEEREAIVTYLLSLK